MLEQRGELAEAEPLLHEALEIMSARYGHQSTETVIPLNALGNFLARQGRFNEAEPLARQTLAICEKQTPDHWRLFSAMTALGGILHKQNKLMEAEPLLVNGYYGMVKRQNQTASPKTSIKSANQRLIQLYTEWGKPVKAAEWQARLDAPDQAGKPVAQ